MKYAGLAAILVAVAAGASPAFAAPDNGATAEAMSLLATEFRTLAGQLTAPATE